MDEVEGFCEVDECCVSSDRTTRRSKSRRCGTTLLRQLRREFLLCRLAQGSHNNEKREVDRVSKNKRNSPFTIRSISELPLQGSPARCQAADWFRHRKAPVIHRASSAAGSGETSPKCDHTIEPPLICKQKVSLFSSAGDQKGRPHPKATQVVLATCVIPRL